MTGVILMTRFARSVRPQAARPVSTFVTRDPGTLRALQGGESSATPAPTTVTWCVLVLIYFITGILVLDRLGVPITSLIAPATIDGRQRSASVHSKWCKTILDGISSSSPAPPVRVRRSHSDLQHRLDYRSHRNRRGRSRCGKTKIRTADGEVVIIPTADQQSQLRGEGVPCRRRSASGTADITGQRSSSRRPERVRRDPFRPSRCSMPRRSWASTPRSHAPSSGRRPDGPGNSSSSAVCFAAR